MKLFSNKIKFLITILSITTIFTLGCQIANAAEPSVLLQKTFTWDTKVKDIKVFGDTAFYYGEDGKTYYGNYVCHTTLGESGISSTATELILGEGETVKKIVGEDNKVFVITEEGHVYARGNNSLGLLGLPELETYGALTKVEALIGVENVITTTDKTWFITSTGVYGVGENSGGELGIGSTTDTTILTKVGTVSGGVTNIITNYCRTWFLTAKEAYATGENSSGSLGVGHNTSTVTTPEQVQGVTNIIDVQTKNDPSYGQCNETVFLTANGEAYNCGAGYLARGWSGVVSTPVIISDNIEEKINKIILHSNIRYMISDKAIYYFGDGFSGIENFAIEGNVVEIQKLKMTGINVRESDFLITDKNKVYKVPNYESYKSSIYLDEIDSVVCVDGAYSDMYFLYTIDDYLYIKESFSNIVFETGKQVKNLNNNSVFSITPSSGTKRIYIKNIDGVYVYDAYKYKSGRNPEYTFVEKIEDYDGVAPINNYAWLGYSGVLYEKTIGSSSNTPVERIGDGICEYKNGYYYGLDGTIYSLVYTGVGEPQLQKVGIRPYPRKEGIIIDDLESEAVVRYAFSTADTYEEVLAEEWNIYNKNSGQILLNPPTSGIYYIHMEITQDDTIYKYMFGPYEVTLNGDTIASSGKTDYAYITADMRIPDGMTATFNVVFTPPSDIFLSQELSTDPDRLFFGVIKNGNINIKVYDSAGNDISDRMDAGYVVEVYKNGVYVGPVSDNYLFTKRDEGAISDNVYILKLNVGGANLFTGVGKQYKLEFNGMKGYDSITMQNLIPINTHQFVLNVYVTELPSLV